MKRNKRVVEFDSIQQKIYEEGIEEIVISKEEKRKLKMQIDNLDTIYKQVVMLRISGEMSFKEIGMLLNKTENWARVTYYRAKNKLMMD